MLDLWASTFHANSTRPGIELFVLLNSTLKSPTCYQHATCIGYTRQCSLNCSGDICCLVRRVSFTPSVVCAAWCISVSHSQQSSLRWNYFAPTYHSHGSIPSATCLPSARYMIETLSHYQSNVCYLLLISCAHVLD